MTDIACKNVNDECDEFSCVCNGYDAIPVGANRKSLMKRLKGDKEFYKEMLRENEELTKELLTEPITRNASSIYWIDMYRYHYRRLVLRYRSAEKRNWVLPFDTTTK